MKLCVIPARGGSKRIPKKNIKYFCGKPMIEWTILTAIKSNCFDKIIVSTDSEEIAEISKKIGAEVPFLRPNNISDDHTGTIPVISHAINFINDHFSKVDYACCIYATAPFVEASFIQEGFKKIKEENANYSFSATSYPFPIQRAIKITSQNRSQMFFPENFNTRSQDLENSFHDAGQFYWGKASSWLENRRIFDDNSIPIIIPRYKVQDIDDQEDWERAEIIFELIKKIN